MRSGTGARRFVYNGLDLSEYRFQSQKEDYDLFLGRLHSVKGYAGRSRGRDGRGGG